MEGAMSADGAVVSERPSLPQNGAVELFWIPLGAGAHAAKTSGKIFEAVAAFLRRRPRRDLYHSALEVYAPEGRYVVEQTPVPDRNGGARGVVGGGPVGFRSLRRFRVFRYEIRRWLDGCIPDVHDAVASPVRLVEDPVVVRRILDVLPSIPCPVWGRDELRTGEMWNSNSVIAWTLSRARIDAAAISPPPGGRAPGWNAGVVVAARGEDVPARHTARIRLVLDALSAAPIWSLTPFIRSWHLRWGSTPDEVAAPMPGDEVVRHAQFNATRAITIDAPPDEVWPWIVQLGYGRAGFYTYDLIDNAGVPSAKRIVEEFQDIHVGDLIPMFHEVRDLAIAYKVDSLQANEWMLWVHRPHRDDQPDSTWSWRLAGVPGGRTRLVTRMKQEYRWKTPALAAFNLFLMEVGDFAMERRMLQGIKSRAELVRSGGGDLSVR
jgi:hypothetical protein